VTYLYWYTVKSSTVKQLICLIALIWCKFLYTFFMAYIIRNSFEVGR